MFVSIVKVRQRTEELYYYKLLKLLSALENPRLRNRLIYLFYIAVVGDATREAALYSKRAKRKGKKTAQAATGQLTTCYRCWQRANSCLQSNSQKLLVVLAQQGSRESSH